MSGERIRRVRPVGLCLALISAFIFAVPAIASAAASRYVYVSNGFFAGAQSISALKINNNGSLSPVSGSPYPTGGTVTEGVAITPDAENVYVANFGTSNVSGYSVRNDGGLTALIGSPFGGGFSTPLGVVPDPDGGHLFAWNHGSAIAVSNISSSGALSNIGGSPFTIPAGQTNPFAGSVAPDGDHLYAPHENATPVAGVETNTVGAYSIAASGAVSNIQLIQSGNASAAGSNPFGSTITPDGKFLYVSNPEDGANGTITGYSVNANGTLSALPGFPRNAAPGNHPLNMAVSPDGEHLYVATRVTNSVNAYTINGNGSLTTVPGQPFATGGLNGKAIALTPDGKRLYVSNQGADNISGFNVASNGALSLIAGSPWPTGGDPLADTDLESIVITPNQPPVAAFSQVEGLAVQQPTKFNANFSDDSDGGTIARYAWDFGDGTTQADGGPTPEHTYALPGTYTVKLTVTDDEGCSAGRIFTGKATLCNGSGVANSASQVTITAPKCAGKKTTIFGTSGSDVLNGTTKADVISGFGAGDKIRGLGGDDRICAGQGKDTAKGDRGKDRIRGGPGNDELSGGTGGDRINGGTRKDRLFGGPGNDILYGGQGRDKLFGGSGRDTEIQ
jgi:6-phosphogluconolactonase (cycloisomerase 2 family)